MLRFTPLAIALLVAGCSTEPAQIVPPPSAQHPLPEEVVYEPSYVPEVQVMADESVWTPVPQEPVSTMPAVAPSSAGVDEANAAKARGDTPLYLALLQQGAETGNAQAHYDLAKVFTEGTLAPRDLGTASEHLRAAADLGHPEAIRVIGWQMIRGDNGPADLQGGAALIEQAAQTSVRAQREAGMLFANLYQYRLNDVAKGKIYLAMAADAADADAAFQLGKLFHEEGNDLEAVPYLSAATNQGNARAAKLLQQIDPTAKTAAIETAATLDSGSGRADSESLYQQANAIILRSKRSLDQEARAYAMFTVAHEQGHQLAGMELRALAGVKTLMDERDPGWLEREKLQIIGQH